MAAAPADNRSDEHLQNAARTLQALLNNRDPEHSYVVSVREEGGEELPAASSENNEKES